MDTEQRTWRFVVKLDSRDFLITPDEGEDDRCDVEAATFDEAVGKLLIANPKLSYDAILDHMEV
jgi:hypothetical protein